MRTVLLIGIGAGDPEHVTVQAVNALKRVDVFFVLDKGEVKQDLAELREEILARYAGERPYRVVRRADPERGRSASAYLGAVDDWHRRRTEIYEQLIRDELGEDETGPSWCGATRPCTTARSRSWRTSTPVASPPSSTR